MQRGSPDRKGRLQPKAAQWRGAGEDGECTGTELTQIAAEEITAKR